ncbi:hypothetical protein ACFWY9_28585 [Amycolatopsis sp. NPDC059027]|uniref:hypothetical protein n=1 Tax=Amycolatopsis sp. NPDC059027 TaxID=3346709 RepID=UPI0036704B1D
MSAPAPTTTFTPKYQRPGSYWTPGFVERGVINLTIRAYAEGNKSWAALRLASLKMLALCQDTTKLYPLVFRSEIGNLVQNVAREGDILIKPITAQDPAFEASIQLTSPDPRRYFETKQTLTVGLPQNSTTGLDFATGGGLDYAASGGGLDFGPAGAIGILTVDNTAGTAPTSPELTLTGPLTTPSLSVPGGSITYNASLATGEFLVINPEDPSALLGGTASRGYLVNPAKWSAFVVQPGSSLSIGLSHSGPSTDLGTLTASYSPAFW